MTTIPEGERPVRERRGLRRRRPDTVAGRVRTGIWSLIVVVVLAALGFAVFSVLSGAWMLTPILSGSMRPGLPVGGVAVSERVPASSLAVRDVIIFQNPLNPDVTMVHRIIQLNFNSSGQAVVKTQGDANTIPDQWTATLRGKNVYVVQLTAIIHAGPRGSRRAARISARGACGPEVEVFPWRWDGAGTAMSSA